MTQYQRITGKVFGGNATATGNDPQIAQFGSALANTFVGTTDPETIQSLPAWGQGWIGAVTPETQFPPLPEMTGAMKVLSHQICGILQQGVSTWDSGTIYYIGNFVSLNSKLYISQTDENQGNDPATDTTNWQEFRSGGGSFVGQTIFSLDPLYEDTLHLLDGALLQIGGIYDEFITDYIAKLYVSNPSRFCTETEWQTTVKTYGVCGKYVYNEGVSVRLPRVTGIVEGTLDANALGEIIEAGLPNITGEAMPRNDIGVIASANTGIATGAFKKGTKSGAYLSSGGSGFQSLLFDASLSNSIYGKSNKVQPQTIQGYYYIVVATGSKTDIEVNLDNIATDLNGKADTDLTNLSTEGRATGASLAMPSSNFITLEWGASGSAYIAPANGYINAQHGITGTTGDFSLQLNINERMFDKKWAYLPSATSSSILCTTIPVKKGDTVSLIYQYPQNPTITTTLIRFFYAEGEV